MQDLLNKLSSYNIFNYLFPGILYVVLLKFLTGYNLILENILLGAFLYYFIGLVISRIGSIVIEPIMKYFSLISFLDYSKFVNSSIKDEKINILSEVNNMYRTICSLMIILLVSIGYKFLELKFNFLSPWGRVLILIILLVIFILSYIKQTNYIKKRIEIQENN